MTTSPSSTTRTSPSSRSGGSSPREHHVRLRLHGRAGPAPAALRQGHAAPVDRQRPARLEPEVDPNNPVGMPDEMSPLFGTEWWDKLDDKQKGELRRHVEAWRFSQFMHGEQGALICTAKIVQTVPDIDSKFYAATQVIDEARHVEVYSRYLHEKLQLAYPLNKHLKALLDDVIADSRWDMTYLGMQVLIEGLALAAFGIIRNNATEPAGQGAERLRDAGRGAARHVRPPGAARLLPPADPGRARRARGLLRRGLLPDARPLLGRGGLRAPRPPAGAHDLRRGERDAARVPELLVHAHRADPARHRPVGSHPAQGLRGHGRHRLRRHRHRRRDGRATSGRPRRTTRPATPA